MDTEARERERREFEQWAATRGFDDLDRPDTSDDAYCDIETDAAWRAWQAAASETERLRTEWIAAADKLLTYIEDHNWGTIPEPWDSINPLLKLMGRGPYERGSGVEANAVSVRSALMRLANEASGFVSMADPNTHGHTNIAVLKLRIAEARAALGGETKL